MIQWLNLSVTLTNCHLCRQTENIRTRATFTSKYFLKISLYVFVILIQTRLYYILILIDICHNVSVWSGHMISKVNRKWHSQDETPPFSENSKAPFSHLSVTIQSTEWQAHFSDHSVTIQCHSVTIPSPFSNIQFPFFPYITDLI